MKCYISNTIFTIFHENGSKEIFKKHVVLMREHRETPSLKMIQKRSAEENEKVRKCTTRAAIFFVCVV